MTVDRGRENIGHAHIIGAGVAGLAAAVRLAKQGVGVTVYEAAGHGGGRCRSFYDKALDRRIDNGNHLMLSGNAAIRDYLRDTGATDALTGPGDAAFPFIDLGTGETWTVQPDEGAVPWSILLGHGRIPGTRLAEYFRGFRLARAGAHTTIAECLGGPGKLFERFWEPLSVGVLNTPAETASAALLWPVIKETFGRGRAHCRPLMARVGLSEAFVDPAMAFLAANGAEIKLNRRLRAIEWRDDKPAILTFTGEGVSLQDRDIVILAVPAWNAAALIPNYQGPTEAHAIVNVHFHLPSALNAPSLIGLVGGITQWVFVRDDVAAVTVSAADHLAEQPNEAIAQLVWPEVSKALGLSAGADLPAWRVVKEKRATIRQTPQQNSLRPSAKTQWGNLYLAGDWTDTGLPATIEGAIRSGNQAAHLAFTFMTRS